jgi:hypothetical protein
MKSSYHFFNHSVLLCPKLCSTNQCYLSSLISNLSSVSLVSSSYKRTRVILYRRGTDNAGNTALLFRGTDYIENTRLLLLPILCYLATSCNIRPQRTQLQLLRVGTYLQNRCLAMHHSMLQLGQSMFICVL